MKSLEGAAVWREGLEGGVGNESHCESSYPLLLIGKEWHTS